MIILRILGIIFLVGAFAAGAYEISLWIDSGTFRPVALGELWYTWHRSSLNLMQAVTQRYLHPAIWEPGIVSILTRRAWVVLGIISIVLLTIAWIVPRLRRR